MSNQSITIKNPSPLVQAVLALDNYLSELNRLGEKITGMDMRSEFDFEQAQKWISRFSVCGEGVSEEVMRLSTSLVEARAQAENAAEKVSEKAKQLQERKLEEQAKMDQLRFLTEKVRELTIYLSESKRPEGAEYSEADRAKISMQLASFENHVTPLIQEARNLKLDAQKSKMKALEQSADSLEQSLTAISKRLTPFQKSENLTH